MKKFSRFAAAALSVALAATMSGCKAPGAITFGNGTKTALTIDGYDVPAGVFINNEITAYREAMMYVAMQDGKLPTFDDMKKASIDGKDAEEWIRDRATESCKLFVAVEKEFDKIGEELTDEEKADVKNYLKTIKDNDLLKDNGISEDSVNKINTNIYKQNHLFDHYYGLDKERGCSEEDLKKYFVENTARVKYIEVKLADSEGNAYSDDVKHELDDKIDKWVKEVNSQSTNEAKLAKMDEIKSEYEEYAATITAEDGSEGNGGDSAVTTTTTASDSSSTATTTTAASTGEGSDESAATSTAAQTTEASSSATTTAAATGTGDTETTTTTTTDPYANEVTVTKRTTTTANESSSETTTTEPAEETDAQKAANDFNDKVFGDLDTYKAVRYEYDKDTVYILIKADIEERMTSDDIWTAEKIDDLLQQRYGDDFHKWIEGIANSYSVKKNDSAYKRYAPFKLDIKDVTIYG